MPAKDLGTKHVCFKCGTRFYDLNKAEPLCPKCGADQRDVPVVKPATEKRVRAAARPVAPEPDPEVPAVEVDEDAEADEEEDEDEDDDDDES